ncbi:uncharacterized protein LOC116307015 [Actinia tenebrosa]|uniref:Uncharacterized protein LOC116307015 n=1 Tax=Actinia tenebrosa TaxID=6105 RepID=A0A6P8J4V0_ACTTE|nr:uncharacterized protein LOC116307015 [Actinia tenebrosa]
MSEICQFPDERASVGDTFRCRKCRVYLFCFDNLSPFHKKTEPVDQCSAWYIDSDEIDGSAGRDTLVWVKEAVNKSQWTEGKLYCPKCTSRIGSFNFTQGVRCSCFTYIIPAIWFQKCKVDQISACDSKPNIRLPDNPDNNSDGDSHTQDRSPMYYMESSQTGSQSSQTCSDSGQSELKTNESGSQTKMDLGKYKSLLDKEVKYSCRSCCCEQEIGLETLNSGYQIDSRQTELTNCPERREHSNRDSNNGINLKVSEKRTRNYSSSAMQGKENPSQLSCTELSHVAESRRIHRRKINRQKKFNAEVLQFQHGEFSSTNEHVEEVPSSHLHGRCLDRDDGSRFEMLEEMKQNHDFDEKTADHSDEHKLHHKLEEIPDQVTCPVCLDLLYDPLMCPCSHVFCDSCLRILNSKSRHSVLRCPLCRKAVYYVYAAIEIRKEIKKCYPKAYKARHKAERRAPHRRLPLPNGRMKPRQKRSSRVQDVPMPYSVLVVLACVLACCGLCLLILFVFCPPTRNGCITVIGYEWMNGY